VLCGDALITENHERLMDGAKADLVITDPPYNVAIDEPSQVVLAEERSATVLMVSFRKCMVRRNYHSLRSRLSFPLVLVGLRDPLSELVAWPSLQTSDQCEKLPRHVLLSLSHVSQEIGTFQHADSK
jgi:hypothetical protein